VWQLAQRACHATRSLLPHGFEARNTSGGMPSRAILGTA